MTTIDDTTALRDRLTDELTAGGFLTSPVWRAAFRSVPRHVFAPRFAVHDPEARTFVRHDTADPNHDRRSVALAVAYSNDTLMTRWDKSGNPISSSTEPSLMAAMLEALDARPGHRVLEIGAGTGYNAALLCHALGEDNVTTIDVDGEFVGAARSALAAAGYHPDVRCGNGAEGVADRAPFDRIIATCGVDRVPTAWINQLAPGGAILVNVSKGIVLLRASDAGVSGRFLGTAGFMPLRTAGDAERRSGRAVIDATSGEPDTMCTASAPDIGFVMAAFLTALVADRSELVSLHAPDDTLALYHWIHPGSESWARVELDGDQAVVSQAGPRQLWTELTPVLESWHAAGRPWIDRYGLTVTWDGSHVLWLDDPNRTIATLP